MKIRVLDLLSLVLVTVAIGAVSLRVYTRETGSSQVRIEAGGKSWIYPLDQERTLDVSGPIGVTRIRIEKGHAFVLDSPCPDKLCVHMGQISQSGQWAACMPNRVFLRIGGTAEDAVDDATF
jgi:hypothetical protein